MSIWSEQPPVNIPGLNPGVQGPLAQMLAQMKLAKTLERGGQAEGSPARPGSLSPGPPQPGTAGVPGMGGAQNPLGSLGTYLPKAPTGGPISSAAPQIPYVSGRNISSSKQGLIADSIASVFNTVQQKKQQNEQKEFIRAENTWSTLLAAQEDLRNNRNVDNAKATIDEILSDKKRMKEVEESLQIFLPKEGGGQEEKTPATVGAHSAIRKFMDKMKQVGQAAAGTMDPRTQAMKMPGGQQGPAPNTPGGYRFNYPQPSAVQSAIAQQESDPATARAIARQELKLDPTPAQKAQLEAAQKRWEATMEFNKNRLAETDRHNKEMEKLNQERIDAYAKKIKAAAGAGAPGFGKIDQKALSGYMDKVSSGQMQISAVPTSKNADYRGAVMAGLDQSGTPIMKKFNTTQQGAWDSIDQANKMLDPFEKTLNKILDKYPAMSTDEGFGGLVHGAKARASFAKYSAGLRPDDPDVRELIKDAAYLRVNGVAPFLRIGRNRLVYTDIIQHLPSPTDTVAQMMDKASWMRNMLANTKEELNAYRWSTDAHPPSAPSAAPAQAVPQPPPMQDTAQPQMLPQAGEEQFEEVHPQ